MHHLILTMADAGIEEATRILKSSSRRRKRGMLRMLAEEAKRRSCIASPRLAMPSAIARSMRASRGHRRCSTCCGARRTVVGRLPPVVEAPILHQARLRPMLLHVFHPDYINREGKIAKRSEGACGTCSTRAARIPAEHKSAIIYNAKPALVAQYKELDPGRRLLTRASAEPRNAPPPPCMAAVHGGDN